MPLLYYWRADNYQRDIDYGAGFHLNQANPLLHEVETGDSLWAFTRSSEGRYVLAAELVVKARTQNPPGFRYGRFRVWGDLKESRYFAVEGQPGVEQVIRGLSCTANARVLGRSFQGLRAVKRITVEDHQILRAAARDLPLEQRARILPEEALEAALLLGDGSGVYQLIEEEKPGISEARRRYLYQQAPTRSRKLVEELHGLYGGRCQICLWDPRSEYGTYLCSGHHIHWLSRGGSDALENLALVCPNHHRAIHRLDAPLDFEDLSFDFGSKREKIRLNVHL